MIAEETIENFRTNGYSVINEFLTEDETRQLKDRCAQFVDGMDIPKQYSIFQTGQQQTGDEYFITSGDKIRYFFEAGAFDQQGQLKVDKNKCLNKIGHALHWLDPVFKSITFSDKIKALAKKLDFVNPVVVQSMYIFKNPGIGGEVIPHQDATFISTKPNTKLLGFWFALDEVTLDNGCLWFIPASHNQKLSRRFIRNVKKSPPIIFTAEQEEYNSGDFLPLPTSAGSCVLIDGYVVHKSLHNNSTRPRPAYTFHIVEADKTEWCHDNWLQPTASLPFPSLYDN